MKELQEMENKISTCNFIDKESKMYIYRLVKEKQHEILYVLSQKCIEFCLKEEKKFHMNIFSILYLNLLSRNKSTDIDTVELFDVVLRKCTDALNKEMDKIDKCLLNESLKNINETLGQNTHTLTLNMSTLYRFAIQCMMKACKAEIATKLLAFSVLKKIMEVETKRSNIIEEVFYNINLLVRGKINLGGKFILLCYEKKWFSFPVYVLFDTLLNGTETLLNYTEDLFLNITSNITQCKYSMLFSINFLKYFIEKQGVDEGFRIFLRVYKEVVDFYSRNSEFKKNDKEMNEFCKEMFDLENIEDVQKYYVRKTFLFCLDIISKKNHTKRTLVAKTLLKINLRKVLTFNRKNILKNAKALLRSEQISIFEVGVQILSHLKQSFLFEKVNAFNDKQKKRIIFEYLKEKDSEMIYSLFLDLLASENTRDVDFDVKDISKLSKAFYNFSMKEVCRYLDLDQFKVEDIYTADLALWYSKYYPDKIEAVHLVSFFLNTNQQFLISKNINFYVKLIGILNNIAECLSYTLKRRLIVVLKDLLFYTPYTKEVGLFFSKIECNKFVISSKRDYFLVVLAACNHPEFKSYFLESTWSPTKDRALVYILNHQPSYGINYKWRLIEILKGNDPLTILEFMNFLSEGFSESFSTKFGDEISNFYFSFIDENQNLLFDLMKSDVDCLRVKSCSLVYKATKNKCLLPEKSIPLFLSYVQNIPPDIYQYEQIILNNINLIQNVFNEKFIFSIFNRIIDKKSLIESLVLDTSLDVILKNLSLILKTNKQKYSSLIFSKVRDFQISLEDEEAIRKTQAFLDQ